MDEIFETAVVWLCSAVLVGGMVGWLVILPLLGLLWTWGLLP